MRLTGVMLHSVTYILHEALPIVKPIYGFFAQAAIDIFYNSANPLEETFAYKMNNRLKGDFYNSFMPAPQAL